MVTCALTSHLAGCASAPPPWSLRAELPRSEAGEPLLIDCTDPDEAALCTSPPPDSEHLCIALLQQPTALFGARRCLAFLAVERARTTTQITIDNADPTRDAVEAMVAFEIEQTMQQAASLAIARMHLEEALAVAPDEHGLYVHLMAIDERVEDAEALVLDATRLTSLLAEPGIAPQTADLRRIHGYVFRLTDWNRPDDALQLLDALALHHPSYVPARIDLGTALIAREAYDDAATVLQGLLDDAHADRVQIRWDEVDALALVLAELQLERGLTDAASAALEETTRRGAHYLITLAKVRTRQGDGDQARKALEQVLADADAVAFHPQARDLLRGLDAAAPREDPGSEPSSAPNAR